MNKLVLGAVVAALTYLLLLFLTPLVRFHPWFKWWNDHQPQGGPKQNCLPLALLAYQSSADFLYGIAALFMVTENQKLEKGWQAEFLLHVMGRWGVDVADNGFLTPYGLCTSVAPQKDDTFYDPPPRVSAQGSEWPSFTGWPQDLPDSITKKFSQRQLWLGVLASWGCQANPDVPNTLKKDTGDLWTKEKSNFLYQKYQIPYDSKLCASFVLNTDADPSGNLWFSEAMATLLGVDSESGAGGWVGLVRAGGDWGGYGLVNMEAYVWSDDLSALPTPKSPLKKCGTEGAASATLQGLNMGAMGAMVAASVASGPFAPFSIGLAGIAGLVGGGLIGASQYKSLGG